MLMTVTQGMKALENRTTRTDLGEGSPFFIVFLKRFCNQQHQIHITVFRVVLFNHAFHLFRFILGASLSEIHFGLKHYNSNKTRPEQFALIANTNAAGFLSV